MSNSLRNSTIQTKTMNESNTTTTIPVTSLLHEVIKVTTEMARIMTNGTTMESHTELPTTTMTTAKTTTTTTMIPHTTPTPPATTQFSWNLTKTTVTPSVANATGKICSTTVSTTTVDPFDEFGPPEGVEYIFVPLGVMIFVIVLSAVVLIVSRRRKLERLRHRLMPLYNFDPGEEGEDDWETELLDEGFGSRQRRQGYQTMDSEENAELFGPH